MYFISVACNLILEFYGSLGNMQIYFIYYTRLRSGMAKELLSIIDIFLIALQSQNLNIFLFGFLFLIMSA